MKLYNTMSRQVETFEPRVEGKVGLYACGPTVYDYAHLGHLRKYSMDDVLVRTLRHAGYEVEFVENITDVGHLVSDGDTGEDKLEKGAKKYGKSVWDIAQEFEQFYWASMDQMHNLRPDVVCHATKHIPEQLEMVKQLEAKGFAYVVEGDGVYFDTSQLPDYGKLARLKLEDQEAGARVEVIAGKRNPADFALWKFEREGENRAMSWPSPWADKSFPGWHIECSAMSMKYLGEQFDIHTGGIDHIPVHHTNEIAQAEAATGKQPFVKYWVHHNFLRVEDEKMSKSLGNFLTIDDVVAKGFSPEALRLLFLGAHYRSELNFTWDSLAGAQKAWEKLVSKWLQVAELKPATKLSDQAQGYSDQFFAAMEDDLNTPKAVATLWQMVGDSNLNDSEIHALLLEFDQVLGFELTSVDSTISSQVIDPATTSSEVQVLLEKRASAKANKDFETSDAIRDQLLELGFRVEDKPTGPELYPAR